MPLGNPWEIVFSSKPLYVAGAAESDQMNCLDGIDSIGTVTPHPDDVFDNETAPLILSVPHPPANPDAINTLGTDVADLPAALQSTSSPPTKLKSSEARHRQPHRPTLPVPVPVKRQSIPTTTLVGTRTTNACDEGRSKTVALNNTTRNYTSGRGGHPSSAWTLDELADLATVGGAERVEGRRMGY
ncbi:unnamed protein product [Zymoseptoria tritici ST99CH_1A5]|uniref:Uncharacterized protein n=1 Tax=Zymoseptoria tritici ST99CH_1A5 TaxID=1276529 RepID=A0A1Y6M0J7_ZYMTR|nr:unnamed protein product [Zymoseptoria tritici ST99CH_1A5]